MKPMGRLACAVQAGDALAECQPGAPSAATINPDLICARAEMLLLSRAYRDARRRHASVKDILVAMRALRLQILRMEAGL